MEKNNKINQLLQSWPPNAVYLTAWLKQQGYSTQLLNRYKKSQWIVALGNGAMLKAGDKPTIAGALFALQQQAGLSVHPAAKTALQLAGKAHYLAMGQQSYILFGNSKETLPAWVKKHPWQEELKYVKSAFLPAGIGMVEQQIMGLPIKISGAARALMECLYLAPQYQDLQECYEIMEGLNNLRPKVVQQLLEQCTSIKVKRLFLYLAKKAGHQWLAFLNLENIYLGKGKRKIVDNGAYIPEFKITVPKSLAHG
ncbi:MAG: type IV toxin-antitoxin system AbiEi family antitoxin domain-containing protein [Chitinophagales bacterium]